MLALVSIFLATIVIAAALVWLHRTFFGVQNYNSKAIAKNRSRGSMKLGAQQGQISLGRQPKKSSRNAKVNAKSGVRVASGGNKVPWGW